MDRPKLVAVGDALPLNTPLVERARRLRVEANAADRQIAADLERDLRLVCARCGEMGEFLGVPDSERSEFRQIGTLIERALAAINRVRG